ncbi:hypothetical protein HDC92_000034 [Pedobacter sp. AK017]|uniref:beta-1,6-N-acetylglucosaminyltransferase n=1 Tax=Pedobacter sp. AK017 TaxID=2723073 RepID=UPI00161016C6|nr:beta-1,6-N-acetylglucosaminyltransferase [Pedobacter sp. AK017]MBB5436370.1 hypothetical protein [Pedobacter sp. AK017]
MRIAHVIMAHKNKDQLLRLIQSLNHPMFDIYLHIDAKVHLEQFESFNAIPNFKFIKNRSICNWGGYSLFKGILNCMDEVLNSGVKYDFINLLSGQDYPICSTTEIYNFFKNNQGKSFLAFEDSDQSLWWKEAAYRFQMYHFTDFNFTGKYFIQKIINKIAPARKFPEAMTLYGGNKACWWTISSESAVYILEQLKSKSKLNRFLRFCWGTDEFVIPTLLMNSPLKGSIVNNNFRYIDWSEGNPNPKILRTADFINIMDSKMLFARKFDIDIDPAVMDEIDTVLLNLNPPE